MPAMVAVLDQALILMGDWCAMAQPNFENQVRGDVDKMKCSFVTTKCGGDRSFLLVPIDR